MVSHLCKYTKYLKYFTVKDNSVGIFYNISIAYQLIKIAK